jgi:hypothetical protein
VESTHSQWREGQTEIVTFADTDGNWYRMEADYDGQSRLLEFRTFLNGEFVGRTSPTWAYTEQTEFMATSYDEGYWARTNGDYEVIDTSESQFEVGCGEQRICEQSIQETRCREQWWNYGTQSAGLVAGVGLVGAGVLSTGPAAPFALWGSIGGLAVQTRNWYLATRALDACIKATRNRTESVGINVGDLEYAT